MKNEHSMIVSSMSDAGRILGMVSVSGFIKKMDMEDSVYDSFSESSNWECTIKPTGILENDNIQQVELKLKWD